MAIRVNERGDLARYRQQGQALVPQGIPASGQAGMGGGGFPQMIASLPAGQRDAAGQAGKEIAEIAQFALGVLEKRRAMQDAADYADATTRLQEEALRFQSGFAKERQGRDARGASDAFFGQVNSAAERMAKGFGDRPELAQKFRQYAGTLALRALGSGLDYEEKQEAAVRKDALDGKLALFSRALGTGSDAEIAMARAEYEGALHALAPGLDHTAQLARLDHAQAGAAFERRLAAGDLAGAGAVLKSKGAMLGEDLPKAEQKLAAAGRALAAEAERRRNEETRRGLAVFQADMQGARATFQTADARKSLDGLRGRIPEADWQRLSAQVEQVDADRLEGLAAAQLPLPALKESLAEIGGILSERDEEGRSPHSPEELARAEHRLKVISPFVKAREAAYKENPAGAARRALLSGASPAGALSEGMTEEEAAGLILEDQRLNGVRDPKVLPGGLAFELRKQWLAADLKGRAAMSKEIAAKWGRHSAQALQEIAGPAWTEGKDGSPGRYSMEAEAAADYARDASMPEESAAFMQAHSLRGKAVETDMEDADVKDAVLAALEQSGLYKDALGKARSTGSAELFARAQAIRETAEVLVKQGRDADAVAAILDRGKKWAELDSVPRKAPEFGSEEAMSQTGGGVGFWGMGGDDIPFRVRAELPPGMTEGALASRIGSYGRESLADFAKLCLPDIPKPKRRKGAQEGSPASAQEGGASGTADFGETEEEYAVRLAQWKEAQAETEASRRRLEENLIRGGTWMNSPRGTDDEMVFFSSTGAALFSIPLKEGPDERKGK